MAVVALFLGGDDLCSVSRWLWSMCPHDEPPGTPRPLWSGKCCPLGMLLGPADARQKLLEPWPSREGKINA